MKLYHVLLELLQKPLSHYQRFFTYFLISSLFMCNFVKVDILAENLFDDRISLNSTPIYQNVEFIEYLPLKIDIFSKIINTSFTNNINLQAENSYYQPQISYNKSYKINNYIKYSSNSALNINYPVFEDNFINSLFDIKIRDLTNSFIQEVNKYETNTVIKNNDKAQFNLDSNLYFLDESLLFMKFEIDTIYDTNSLPVKYYEMYIYDLQTKQEVSLENFVFGDYLDLFVEEAISYFKNTYNIVLNENSVEYKFLQPTDINYNRIFLNENFVEVVIYDYIINKEVLLNINLDKLQGVINPQYLTSSIISMMDLNQVTPTLIQNQSTTDLVEIPTDLASTEPLIEATTDLILEPVTEVIQTEPVTQVIPTEPATELTTIEIISTEPVTELISESVTIQEQTDIITNNTLEVLEPQSQISITAEQPIIGQEQVQNQVQEQNPVEVVESVLPNGIRELEKNKPMVALTFDDGPSYNSTNQILDILEEYNSLGTFFVIGSRLDANTETLIRTAEAGHQIGNHTYNHQNLTKYGTEDIKNEILISNEKIFSILGEEPSIVRVPYGATNDIVRESIDYPIIAWNRDPRDWELRDAQGVQEAVLSNVVDGDIILMHDLYMSTADACLTIIPELVSRGFQLVTIDELMYYRDLTMNTNQVYGSAPSLIQ